MGALPRVVPIGWLVWRAGRCFELVKGSNEPVHVFPRMHGVDIIKIGFSFGKNFPDRLLFNGLQRSEHLPAAVARYTYFFR